MEVCFRSVANPIYNIENHVFFIVMMRRSYDIRVCSEEIYSESAAGRPSLGWRELEEASHEILGVWVFEEMHARVIALTGDARPIRDRDPIVRLHAEDIIVPCINYDVAGSFAVGRKVSRIVVEGLWIVVILMQVFPSPAGKADRIIGGQRIALIAQGTPDSLQAEGVWALWFIGHQ